VKRTARGRARPVDAVAPQGHRYLVATDLKEPPYFRAVPTHAVVTADGAIELTHAAFETLGIARDTELAALALD
jgi:hypothetical protein